VPKKTPLLLRLLGEVSVIVLGVLLALAADRWNESRSESDLEGAFVSRITAEIRSDSLLVESYLSQLTQVMASRDSLIDFVDGSPAPADLRATIVRSFLQLSLPAPVAWSELQVTSSLNVISDPVLRTGLVRYYSVDRANVVLNLERADRRGRDPFVDALYRIGWIQPTGVGDAVRPIDPASFRESPGMRQFLIGLGSAHGVQANFGRRLLSFSGDVLATLSDHERGSA
jgi:hypothetical protein